MQRVLLALIIWLSCATASYADEPVGFVALGDLPYGKAGDDGRYAALITAINERRPPFSIHVGDTKSGSSLCSDEKFTEILGSFNSFEHPVIYTPGDNEWTDCHRLLAGGFDPVERLSKLREVFFPDAQTLGQNRITLERQADHGGTYVENATWVYKDVRFATLHVVGSDNNFHPGNSAAVKEYLAREAAVDTWMAHVGALANKEKAPALVLAFHADFLKGRDDSDDQDIEAGFQTFTDGLIDLAESYDGPILLIQGDWHDFRFDQPLRDHQGNILENIWRLRVPGAKDIRAVWVSIDPAAQQPFSVTPFGAEKPGG